MLLAFGSWPLIVWAHSALGHWPAVAVGIIDGLSFRVGSAAGFDFYAVAFAVPLVVVKEDLGVTVVAVIGLLLFFRGARRLGTALVM